MENNPMTHKYYVGDLCYVLSNDDWDRYCAQYDWNHPYDTAGDEDGYDEEIWLDPEKGGWDEYMEDDGTRPWRPCYTYGTAYGDGVYTDQSGLQYCVDSGGIGCIRVDHANAEKLADAVARGLGHIHEFVQDDLNTGYHEGTIWFSDGLTNIDINTAGDWEEYEEAA